MKVVTCAHCFTPVFAYDPEADALVVLQRHHGRNHRTVIPWEALEALRALETAETAKKRSAAFSALTHVKPLISP